MNEAMTALPPEAGPAPLGRRLWRAAGWRRNGVMTICGVFGTLALAPFFAWPLLVPSFTLFFGYCVTARGRRRAFADGWWWGFGFFVSGIYWFSYALLVDAARFGWLIPFAVFGLSAIFALYAGLAGVFFHLARGLDRMAWPAYAGAVWGLTEWLRSYFLTGFAWDMVGYSFAASLPSLQAAAWFGILGLSWLTVLLAVLPACLLVPAETAFQRRRYLLIGLGGLVLLGVICALGAWRLQRHPAEYSDGPQFRIVQGGVPQKLKSDPAERLRALKTYADLSRSPGYENIRYLIWSETSMPFPFVSGDDWAKQLATLVPPDGLLLTGVVRIEAAPSSPAGGPPIRIYNSLQAVDHVAESVFSYDKRKLVPFGEFVPLRSVLPLNKITPGTIDFSTGAHAGRLTLADGIQLFPLICYEATFADLSDGAWPAAILNITNDTWFGDSTGPYQHLAMARMRAVEQGVPMLRNANSGVSAVIDPYGRILQSLPLDAVGVIDTRLPKALPHPTFYAETGNQIFVTLVLLSLALTLCFMPSRRCQNF